MGARGWSGPDRGSARPEGSPEPDPDDIGEFLGFIVNDIQDEWTEILPEQTGTQYQDTTLVRFEGQVQTGCGLASSAVGPFYCPADAKVYLDTGFFDELFAPSGSAPATRAGKWTSATRSPRRPTLASERWALPTRPNSTHWAPLCGAECVENARPG